MALNGLPYERLTLVSAHSAQEVQRRLQQATKQQHGPEAPRSPAHKFNGVVNERGFVLSLMVSHANFYLPLVKGRIEPTSSGCILFVRCMPFASTLFMMVFWCVLALCMGVLYLWVRPNYVHAAFALLLGAAFYGIGLANFHLQKKISLAAFFKVLEAEG